METYFTHQTNNIDNNYYTVIKKSCSKAYRWKNLRQEEKYIYRSQGNRSESADYINQQ